ncbi:hypothetical protein N657DRAFT_651756 [Parathielavia appendiculata]|uniref:DUF8212 domain-containing protein n=1 Tax=Parathielavia appendiculata TaxID=2587402 RepID=A0AAN6TP04_9PEZI|nr:hypothetical protein N657DRAFT_651756 [Parathielavia appendiculata]
MYSWYAQAEVCYAYLSDLKTTAPLETLTNCHWFSRGWTLQELIAPKRMIFFDENWNQRGTKKDLVDRLSHKTGIPKAILLHQRPLSSVSVAQKMSWAAGRKTTKVEDTAYCLLGIFGVHLPFLYGEGHRAFRRLQDTIVSSVPDLSIFAWKLQPPPSSTDPAERNLQRREYCGVYAPSPSAFAASRSFVKRKAFGRPELLPMNGSIMARMQFLIEMTPKNGGYRYLLPLDCHPESKPDVTLYVRLRKLGHNEFVRENPYDVVEFPQTKLLDRPIIPVSRYLLPELPFHEEDALIGQIPRNPNADFVGQTRTCALQVKLPEGMWLHMLDVWPGHRFDAEDHIFYLGGHDAGHDSAMARLRGGRLSEAGEPMQVDFECIFCAAGWSSTNPDSRQCTVLDYGRFASALSEFRAEVCGWDFRTSHFLERLVYHGMPRASSAVVQGKKSRMHVSFKGSLVQDPNICRNKFWRIEFLCSPCEEHDAQASDGARIDRTV